MSELEIGTKVTYKNDSGETVKGIIHAVRKIDGDDGEPQVLSYLIDTGEENPDHADQPEQVDIVAEDVEAA